MDLSADADEIHRCTHDCRLVSVESGRTHNLSGVRLGDMTIRMSTNARRTAEERLSWAKLAQAFENHVISARLGEESAGAAQASEAG